jgi:feruloyl esterase
MGPEHCLVRGKLDERTGSDGKDYYIGFELRIPTAWSGRLLYQGGGGLDGVVRPAVGLNTSLGSTAPTALARGFAVVSTDSGHQSQKSDVDVEFAADQEAKLDYGYAAIDKVTRVAKALVARLNGKPPGRSYFVGCSNGGREAMIAAERFPLEFDGIAAGNPAFDVSKAVLLAHFSTSTYAKLAPKGAPISSGMTATDLQIVSDAVLDACDALDGRKDGMIFNQAACHFNPTSVQCGKTTAVNCLSAEKVGALTVAFTGPRDAQGRPLFAPWTYDAGISDAGWREWQTGLTLPGGGDMKMLIDLVTDAATRYFRYPQIDAETLDTSSPEANLMAEQDTAAITDASTTQWSTFRAHGGKVIITTGWSDPIFAPEDLIAWYHRLDADTKATSAGGADQFARLFLVPGMTHCGGGPSFDDFDALTALTDWVEHGQSPESIPARASGRPGESRPLCAYPKFAAFDGQGTGTTSESYSCRAPTP